MRTNPAPQAEAPAATAERPANRELATAFTQAAAEFQVPLELLVAIAQAETGLYFVPGIDGDTFEGQPAYGVMALRGERLARGARLAGVSVSEVQTSVLHNVRAGAALLHAEAGNNVKALDQNDLGAWSDAVARFSGLPTAEAQVSYLDTGVYRVLRAGLPEETARLHGLRLPAHPELPASFGSSSGSAPWQSVIYSGSKWRPSPSGNYTVGRSGTDVELLVIHTCAGAYSGCWSWLNTPYPTNPNKTSAHYVVSEDGAEVSALVDEVNTAHHVGKPWLGKSTNIRSVGIEHGGFSYQGTNVWSAGQVSTSVKLSCDIVKRQAIIQDRNHIIGHYQPDPVNRATDPGTAFPWADYMSRIASCVGGTPPPTGIIVDSNQSNNDANGQITPPSSAWTSSTNVSGYWGSGYFAASTAAVSDAAEFQFKLSAAGTKKVYAWWTSGTDRSTTTPFVIFNAAGTKLATVNKNQQIDGGKWVLLGSFNFTAGWNKVAVSRWTTAGSVVIADAIRVE